MAFKKGNIPWNISNFTQECVICKTSFKSWPSQAKVIKCCSKKCNLILRKARTPWNKGKKCSQLSLAMLGNKSRMGKPHTKETRKKISLILKGRHYPERQGSGSPCWRGGRQKTGNGYMQVYKPDHPNADNRGRVLEHRYIMELKIGRYLTRDEYIDHINENKMDNRIENLQIVTHAENLRLWRMRRKAQIESDKSA